MTTGVTQVLRVAFFPTHAYKLATMPGMLVEEEVRTKSKVFLLRRKAATSVAFSWKEMVLFTSVMHFLLSLRHMLSTGFLIL